ncbi:hypothetical protein [Allofranklinella schreckenbergeri]|uniref:hypothetical protein n=1 Tax=Allofranklinella schreckenbergeri TaxID=1076744 RepID=UPI001EEEFF63|nr:hypothetical protein [Allofranklinella schreckenbergeri]
MQGIAHVNIVLRLLHQLRGIQRKHAGADAFDFGRRHCFEEIMGRLLEAILIRLPQQRLALINAAQHIQEMGTANIRNQTDCRGDSRREIRHMLDKAQPIPAGNIDIDLRLDGLEILIMAWKDDACSGVSNQAGQLIQANGKPLCHAGLPCLRISGRGKKNILEIVKRINLLVFLQSCCGHSITRGLGQQTPGFERVFSAQQIEAQRAGPG